MSNLAAVFNLALAAVLAGALVTLIFLSGSDASVMDSIFAAFRSSMAELSNPPRYAFSMFLLPFLYMLLVLGVLGVFLWRNGKNCSGLVYGVFVIGLIFVALAAAFTESVTVIGPPVFIVAFAAWAVWRPTKHVGT